MSGEKTWVRVARVDDVSVGEMCGVTAAGTKIAIYHLETGEFFATDNICTHEFALLSDGWLEGCEVECPLHAGRYDVRNGKALCRPVERDLRVYDVDVRDGEIFVAVQDVAS